MAGGWGELAAGSSTCEQVRSSAIGGAAYPVAALDLELHLLARRALGIEDSIAAVKVYDAGRRQQRLFWPPLEEAEPCTHR